MTGINTLAYFCLAVSDEEKKSFITLIPGVGRGQGVADGRNSKQFFDDSLEKRFGVNFIKKKILSTLTPRQNNLGIIGLEVTVIYKR